MMMRRNQTLEALCKELIIITNKNKEDGKSLGSVVWIINLDFDIHEA